MAVASDAECNTVTRQACLGTPVQWYADSPTARVSYSLAGKL